MKRILAAVFLLPLFIGAIVAVVDQYSTPSPAQSAGDRRADARDLERVEKQQRLAERLAIEAKANRKSSPVHPDEMEVADLIERSKREILARLKAPASAKFPGAILDRGEYELRRLTDGKVRVFSWVDSQNSFGAMIRSKWMVEFDGMHANPKALQVLLE